MLFANASSTEQVIPHRKTIRTIEPLEEKYKLVEIFDNSVRKVDKSFNEDQIKISELDIGTSLARQQKSQVESLLNYNSNAFPSANHI